MSFFFQEMGDLPLLPYNSFGICSKKSIKFGLARLLALPGYE
jgi:hypothetical protein